MDTDEYELDYETDDGAASSPRHPKSPTSTVHPPATVVEEERGSDADVDEGQQDTEEKTRGGPPRQRIAGSASTSTGRKRALPGDGKVAVLTRKLAHSKRLVSELRHQLQKFYENEAIAFLENKAQEKQRQIDSMAQENRSLQIQQRALLKQVEELQESMENMPTTRASEKEEIRIWREQLRMYKEKQKKSDEREAKLHQQVVDLGRQNKALLERIKELEDSATAPASTIRSTHDEEMSAVIESQEDAITRLQHRVEVMKKASKLERTKHEKTVKNAQDEVDAARTTLESFEVRVLDKEKLLRSQFLEIKQLKRTLKEVVTQLQMNQHLHHANGGRDMRFANQQQHFSVNHHGIVSEWGSSGAEALLSRLGVSLLHSSSSKASSICLSTTAPSLDATRTKEHHRHVPIPPPVSHAEHKTPRRSRGQVSALAKHTRPALVSELEDVPYEDVDPVSFQTTSQPLDDVEDRRDIDPRIPTNA